MNRAGLFLLAALVATPARADNALFDEFDSPYFKKTLTVRKTVRHAPEDERALLPFLRDHRELIKGKRVLVVGVGSGVVPLYALISGARRVVMADSDENALGSAILNAHRLGYDNRLHQRPLPKESVDAYAWFKTGEHFDLIIVPSAARPDAPEGDGGALAASVIGGLPGRLSHDGYAVLAPPGFHAPRFAAALARAKGYDVRLHDGEAGKETAAGFTAYAKERIEALNVASAPLDNALPAYAGASSLHDMLIDADAPDADYPGVVVVRQEH